MKELKSKAHEVYNVAGWQFLKFDARKKIFRGVCREEFAAAQAKSIYRMAHRYLPLIDVRCESLQAVEFCRLGRGTAHEKMIIEGGRHLWYASPAYGHRDYNKSVFAENTERNRRKMALINALASK